MGPNHRAQMSDTVLEHLVLLHYCNPDIVTAEIVRFVALILILPFFYLEIEIAGVFDRMPFVTTPMTQKTPAGLESIETFHTEQRLSHARQSGVETGRDIHPHHTPIFSTASARTSEAGDDGR